MCIRDRYRVLLGYYEATGEQRVKDALVRAFDNLMEGYPMGSSDPFLVDKSFCGHCHGLTIVDALGGMYELTGDEDVYKRQPRSAAHLPGAGKGRV